MQFHEKKDLFDFTSFFAWAFLNFLAHCATYKLHLLSLVIYDDEPFITHFGELCDVTSSAVRSYVIGHQTVLMPFESDKIRNRNCNFK